MGGTDAGEEREPRSETSCAASTHDRVQSMMDFNGSGERDRTRPLRSVRSRMCVRTKGKRRARQGTVTGEKRQGSHVNRENH